MEKHLVKFTIVLIIFVLCHKISHGQLITNLGGARAGISALTFLKIDVSPKNSAMASSQIASKGDPYSVQWNPAALSDVEMMNATFSHNFWIAGIHHSFFSFQYPNIRFGHLALSVISLNTGDMLKRTEFHPEGTGEYFSASNTAIGLTYSKLLTTRFSYGLTLRYINETLDTYSAHTAIADLGFLYRIDYKKLKFAVVLQNFGFDSKLTNQDNTKQEEKLKLSSFPAPLIFSMGISIVPWEHKTDKSYLLTTLQLNHPNDNAANLRIGTEYSFRELFFLRAGYKINVSDQYYPTFGIGVKAKLGRFPLLIDYSVDPLPYLGWRHRIGLQFHIPKKSENRE